LKCHRELLLILARKWFGAEIEKPFHPYPVFTQKISRLRKEKKMTSTTSQNKREPAEGDREEIEEALQHEDEKRAKKDSNKNPEASDKSDKGEQKKAA
jgi:hypothetical protein